MAEGKDDEGILQLVAETIKEGADLSNFDD